MSLNYVGPLTCKFFQLTHEAQLTHVVRTRIVQGSPVLAMTVISVRVEPLSNIFYSLYLGWNGLDNENLLLRRPRLKFR